VKKLLLAVLILVVVAAVFVSPLLDANHLRGAVRSNQNRTELHYHGGSHVFDPSLSAVPSPVLDE